MYIKAQRTERGMNGGGHSAMLKGAEERKTSLPQKSADVLWSHLLGHSMLHISGCHAEVKIFLLLFL